MFLLIPHHLVSEHEFQIVIYDGLGANITCEETVVISSPTVVTSQSNFLLPLLGVAIGVVILFGIAFRLIVKKFMKPVPQ